MISLIGAVGLVAGIKITRGGLSPRAVFGRLVGGSRAFLNRLGVD